MEYAKRSGDNAWESDWYDETVFERGPSWRSFQVGEEEVQKGRDGISLGRLMEEKWVRGDQSVSGGQKQGVKRWNKKSAGAELHGLLGQGPEAEFYYSSSGKLLADLLHNLIDYSFWF